MSERRMEFETRLSFSGKALVLRREVGTEVWRIGSGEGTDVSRPLGGAAFVELPPMDCEHANIFRDYCTYQVGEPADCRRTKALLVSCQGMMIDVDCHRGGDMPLDRIREIIVSDAFVKAVPFTRIVFTGNGFHIHLQHVPFDVDTTSAETRQRSIRSYESLIAAVHRCLGAEFGLKADPNAKEINRNYRVPGTWNVKAMKNESDYGARKRAETVLSRDIDPAAVWAWIEGCLDRYPDPAPRSQESDSVPDCGPKAGEEEIRQALGSIPCDELERVDWIRIGMALKSWDPLRGFKLWDEWSQTDSDRYDASIMSGQWSSLDAAGAVTVGTLFHVAREHGYIPDRRARSTPATACPAPDLPAATLTPAADTHAAPDGAVAATVQAGTVETEDSKPKVLMFCSQRSITETASELATYFETTRNVFSQGGNPIRISCHGTIEDLKADTMRSLVETVCTPVRPSKSGREERVALTKPDAQAILSCPAFSESLGPIEVTVRCALLDSDASGALVPKSGYVRRLKAYSSGSEVRDPQDLPAAVKRLTMLLEDFRFATPADRSRAMVALLSPAIVLNTMIPGRAPGTLVTADESQTGKGYFLSLLAAVYGETTHAISQGPGVANVEELFDATLSQGQPFIVVDNIRGKLDAPKIESFMTETSYTARSAYRPTMAINPTRYILGFTSNKMETTADLANRCNCISLRKQEKEFPAYPLPDGSHGDIRTLVQATQPDFLGAVYMVIKAWVAKGRPRKSVPVYSAFSEFWGVMEYIVTELMGMESPTATLGPSVMLVTKPIALFLRDIAMICERSHLLNSAMSASKILEIASANDVDMSFLRRSGFGTEEEGDGTASKTSLGRHLAGLFGKGDKFEVEDFTVTRDVLHDASTGKDSKRYRISKKSPAPTEIASTPTGLITSGAQPVEASSGFGYETGAMAAIINRLDPTVPPISSYPPYSPLSLKRSNADALLSSHTDTMPFRNVIEIGGIGGIGGNRSSSGVGKVAVINYEAAGPSVSPSIASSEGGCAVLDGVPPHTGVSRYREIVDREPAIRDVGLRR